MSAAPWVALEKWEYFPRDGKVIARVTGRERAPRELVNNPMWWLRNDFEEQVPDWYQPTWPQWRRELYWNYFRNPLQNARCFVWGWSDRNYEVEVTEGRFDQPWLVQRNDLIPPETGYQRCRLTLLDGGETRDFTSYCGDHVVWYWGTQSSGIYGVKFNLV